MALEGSRAEVADRGGDEFRLLVTCVRDYAIFLLDPGGFITTWNPGAERIKGYAASEAIGKHFSIFYPPPDVSSGKPSWELEEASREGRFEDEGWRIRKDGSRFWANVVITALRDRTGVLRGFGKVTRDLTLRREAEETARRLAAEQAARAIAEKGETYQRNLLAVVSHDLRNCLSVILTAGDLLGAQPDDPEKVGRRAAQIVRSAKRMREIIHGIIDYTSAQRAEGIPITAREGTDLHMVCQRVIQEFRVLQPQRRVVYEAAGEPLGEWDAGRLEQVVQNLLGNALKFSPPASPVSVGWSRAGGPDGEVVLEVHNEGPPIPEELLPHIFEPFHAGDRGFARKDGGMGLGLYIVGEIVRAHRGEVSVESDAEHGTTFRVRLPARRPR